MSDVVDYVDLRVVLKRAADQASSGKGKERHARGQHFLKQPIMEIARMVGPGYQAGQAMKKTQEAMGMYERKQFASAQQELLGAINYLAAMYLILEESS